MRPQGHRAMEVLVEQMIPLDVRPSVFLVADLQLEGSVVLPWTDLTSGLQSDSADKGRVGEA